MQIEDLYQKIGQIVFSCGPDNATELYVKATLFPEEDGGEFEFDYLVADSEPDWFDPDPLAVADLSDALRELQRIFIEENTNRVADVSERTIDVGGESIKLNIVKPHGAHGTLPVFMFFHGGGWILGDFGTHERLVRDLVNESGAAAVFVNYTPSPEAHFPVAINQAYAATRWVAEHGSEIGVDGNRLALVGNSVGGNMVAAVALQAKMHKAPAIRYDVMLWPVTDAHFDTGSYKQYENGYFLSRNMMKWFWDAYTTKESDRNNILASPLRASREQLQGLPPTLIQTAELDVLRDEGEAFGRKLDAAGVDVTVTRYNGLTHDYGLLNGLSNVPAVRTAIRQAADELKVHLK